MPAFAGMSGLRLGRLHIGEELPHFGFQALGLDSHRVRQAQRAARRFAMQGQRSSTISLTIAQFKDSVESVLGKLRAASMKLLR